MDEDEWYILEVYISKTQQATIHNLTVAQSFFHTTPQKRVFERLIKKIESMDHDSFLCCMNYVESRIKHSSEIATKQDKGPCG